MIKRVSAISFILLVSTTLFADQAIKPQHFSYTAPLLGGTNSLRQVTLPTAVLEGMTRYDRGDLRVFSHDGQAVPHQFSQAVKQKSAINRDLVFYPFSKAQAANPASIRLQIYQKGVEQTVDVQAEAGQSKKQLREFQYIVENTISQGDDKKPLCALGFDWTQQQPNMILPMKIETSRDLQSWSTLSRKETISKLNYGDSQLIKSLVEIRCTTAKYLRVQWLQPAQSVQLHKISGRYQQAGSKKMQWESLGQPMVGKQGEWLFENPSVAPFERLQLKAPTNGLLYKGKLFAKNDQMSKWVKQQDIVQYRLKIDETELHSDAVNVNGRYRYWKIVLDSETPFNKQQLPEIEVSRQQQQLVYLAQGAEPFVLVYGNADIKPVNNSGIKQLVIALKEAGAAPEMVMLGSSVAVTDKAEIEKKIPWKTMALWGILLVGTGLMGYMAHSLYRQMNK